MACDPARHVVLRVRHTSKYRVKNEQIVLLLWEPVERMVRTGVFNQHKIAVKYWNSSRILIHRGTFDPCFRTTWEDWRIE